MSKLWKQEIGKHILNGCTVYAEVEPIALRNKKRTEMITTKSERLIWQLANFINGSTKLRVFWSLDE